MNMTKTCEPIIICGKKISTYNSHNPHEYIRKIQQMDGAAFYEECKKLIWSSAYAANNSRSDFHFMCDACYDESKRRDNGATYKRAYEAVTRSL